MQHNSLDRTVLQLRQPLASAVVHLSAHSSRIRKTWIRLVERCSPCGQYATLLSGLHLPTRIRDLASTEPKLYREESEQQGQDLARRGVPAECIAAAIALYVESCLPYLLSVDRDGARWARALVQWASVYQFSVLSGYCRYAAAERMSLQDEIGLAERRAQEFSNKIADAYEKERRRLAQDLHDEIGHDLIVLKLYTQVIALDLNKGDIGEVRRKLKESVSLIKHALKSVRHLTFDLGPAVWHEQGFIPAVRVYARQYAVRTGLKVSLRTSGLKAPLPARYETALYKLLQGALSNIAAHAGARHIEISFQNQRGYVVMKIADDGKGFNVKRKMNAPPNSYGLRAMRDRIEMLGGTIHFSSKPALQQTARRGTTIEICLPLLGDEEPHV